MFTPTNCLLQPLVSPEKVTSVGSGWCLSVNDLAEAYRDLRSSASTRNYRAVKEKRHFQRKTGVIARLLSTKREAATVWSLGAHT